MTGHRQGIGFGTTTTSIIVLAASLAIVILVTIQWRRQPVLIDDNDSLHIAGASKH